MNGLELSREYFNNVACPALKRRFPGIFASLAAGLVGNGSECFGYDDEVSRDHDWGIDFYIWTTEGDSWAIPVLEQWKSELYREYPRRYTRASSEYGTSAFVMTCGRFYSGLIGVSEEPKTLKDWLRAPEENFALAINGEVFLDGPGEFTKTRDHLLDYYPEDIRRKRIAAKCMALAQTGQYNHDRTLRRGDIVTLQSVLSRFTDSAIGMVFLLNRVYKPYYKWAYRAVGSLPILGMETARLLRLIAEAAGLEEEQAAVRRRCISELCSGFARELKSQGLCATDDWFLTAHGEEVRQGIEDDFLRSLPAQYEI